MLQKPDENTVEDADNIAGTASKAVLDNVCILLACYWFNKSLLMFFFWFVKD